MRSRILEAYKATLSLTKVQQEVLVGLMLGDGHLEYSATTNRARLKVEQRENARVYVELLYTIFKPWIRSRILTKTQFLKTTGKRYTKCYFTTYRHSELADYHQLFYRKKKKIVPENIANLLTPLGLAIWFMDDGSIKSHQSRGRIFNTHAFSKEEILRLCSVLQDKFRLDAWPRQQSDGIQIYISGKSAAVFQALIAPHIIPMMRYKLPLPLELTNVPKW